MDRRHDADWGPAFAENAAGPWPPEESSDDALLLARPRPSFARSHRKHDGRPLAAPGRLQLATLAIIAVWRLSVFIFLALSDLLHRNRFTYWCYGLETGFYLALGLGYMLRNRFAPRALALFFTPMVFGNVFMVAFLITLILLGDHGLLLEEAAQSANVGVVHFANMVVHMLTLIDFLALLISGYKETVRAEMSEWLALLGRIAGGGQGLVRLYQVIFILLPAVYMLLYVLCWDPFDEYPTPYINPWALVLVALLVGYGAMVWFWHVCTVADDPRARRAGLRRPARAQGDGALDAGRENGE